MRVTFFDFRQGVADPKYQVPRDRPPIPNPGSVLRGSIKAYHVEGYEAAQRRLDRGFSKYFARAGPPAGMARVARANFDVYVKLDSLDGRPVFDIGRRWILDIGPDELVVTVDVLLLDPGGYVGRLVFWGNLPPLSASQLELVATPAILAMRQALGSDRVVGVEIWEVRTEKVTVISSEQADANRHRVNELVERLSSTEG